jgi:hypothetical protein
MDANKQRTMKAHALINWRAKKKWNSFALVYLGDHFPKILKYRANCSYCEIFDGGSFKGAFCPDHGICPIEKVAENCHASDSLYAKWEKAKTKMNAQAMLEAIKSIPVPPKDK